MVQINAEILDCIKYIVIGLGLLGLSLGFGSSIHQLIVVGIMPPVTGISGHSPPIIRVNQALAGCGGQGRRSMKQDFQAKPTKLPSDTSNLFLTI